MTTILIPTVTILGFVFFMLLTLFIYWVFKEEIPYTESVYEEKINGIYLENRSRN